MFKRDGRGYYTRRRVGGKDRWISLGADFDAASRKLRELDQRDRPMVQISVREAAKRWLDSYIATNRNAESQSNAVQRVRDYLEPHLGYKQLSRVTKDDLRAYRLWLEKTDLAVLSVRHILSDAKCLFRWAEDSGWIDRSPVPHKLLPRVQEKPPNRLTDSEVDAILAVPEPYSFIVRLGLGTGLRWGELIRACHTDLEVARGEDGREQGILVVAHTKSWKVRRIPLTQALWSELRFRIGAFLPIQNACGFARMVRRYSGVTRFHAHQMRHTFACRWIEMGGSLAALQHDMVRREVERLDKLA
jgi:integrase